MTSLLLASASPARLTTLGRVGIDALVQVSGVDEDAVLAAATQRFGVLAPVDAVLLLAQAKAQAVVDRLETLDVPEDVLVLGCDSLLDLDGIALGKPRDAEDAVARWRQMRGRSGVLHTGHWLVDARPVVAEGGAGTGGTLGTTSSTTVHFGDLSDGEIDAYVATGEPLAVAGAFTVDGLGGAFIEGIEGDHHGVVGLSLPVLRALLGEIGLTVPDLWR
ncbi:nucleoside triphosphate pyrophosphatase [Actinotalea sp. K2]|uniref:Maf family protein n=1 Tax=Actinotalea sp. K2 TaxID=2939438 RepID=UPI00201759FC|nr:nucleoside triphosphate pyrophosphatase [Actinotalea sp. K2]MCL3862634.1 Maf family nucleotide pyrophosphatase [Actinotalea sp. K2]